MVMLTSCKNHENKMNLCIYYNVLAGHAEHAVATLPRRHPRRVERRLGNGSLVVQWGMLARQAHCQPHHHLRKLCAQRLLPHHQQGRNCYGRYVQIGGSEPLAAQPQCVALALALAQAAVEDLEQKPQLSLNPPQVGWGLFAVEPSAVRGWYGERVAAHTPGVGDAFEEQTELHKKKLRRAT